MTSPAGRLGRRGISSQCPRRPRRLHGRHAWTVNDGRTQAAGRSRRIDTVLVCFADLQGRLIGKRVTASYFLARCVQETHACDYLLADDMDMEPVPGYAAALG